MCRQAACALIQRSSGTMALSLKSPRTHLREPLQTRAAKMSLKKRRKVDAENRHFNPKWTDDFAFILPSHTNAVPLCLICTRTVSVVKLENIKRHYESRHASFHAEFPLGDKARQEKIGQLKTSYTGSTTILTTATTATQKATAASLCASHSWMRNW